MFNNDKTDKTIHLTCHPSCHHQSRSMQHLEWWEFLEWRPSSSATRLSRWRKFLHFKTKIGWSYLSCMFFKLLIVYTERPKKLLIIFTITKNYSPNYWNSNEIFPSLQQIFAVNELFLENPVCSILINSTVHPLQWCHIEYMYRVVRVINYLNHRPIINILRPVHVFIQIGNNILKFRHWCSMQMFEEQHLCRRDGHYLPLGFQKLAIVHHGRLWCEILVN